jgi:type I restriction enzyme S subunit
MKNWKTKILSDVCTVFEDGDWIESKDQSDEGVRLIQTGNVGNGFFKDRGEKARYISEETFIRLKCTEIFEGDCLISRLPDPVGRACIIPDTGEKMITAVDCTIIRFQQKDILPKWFLFYALSNEYQTEITKQITGATRQRISRKNLGLIQIPLPPLPEQQRIVSILDEAFAAINKAKANAEQNLKNAKELFESYLQGVFENKSDGWEAKTLGEVCEELFAGGDVPKGNSSKYETDEFRIPIFSNGEKNKGLYGFTNISRVTKPSITISARGTIGYSEIRHSPFYPAIRLIVVTPKNDIVNLLYLKYVIAGIDFKHSGASIPQLTVPMIKGYPISFPPLNEQKNIVQKLDALSEETKKLEAIYHQKINDLEELKKSVLQKAFSGELKTENKLAAV